MNNYNKTKSFYENKVKEKDDAQTWQRHIRHCIKCDFCLGHNDHCFAGFVKSPKPSKDKPTNKTKLVESSNKLVDKPVKVGWEESIKDILYQVIPDPQMLYWALNWIKKDIKKLLSKQGERIMNKTKYLLETFVWDMGLSISENRRRLNKFVMERETNIDKLVKSIKK